MKRWHAALAAGAVALGIAACGGDDSSSSSGASGEELNVATFGVANSTYFAASLSAMERVIEAEGGSLKVFETSFDPADQFRQIQDATASGQFDAFIIPPVEGVGVVPAIEEAIQEGIEVVAISSPAGTRQDTTEVQVPGMAGAILDPPTMRGQWLGGLVTKACEGLSPCEVAWEVADAKLPTEQLFLSEAEKVMAETPGIEAVATVSTGLQAGPAAKATADVLQAHPDLNVIAASGDQAIVGAQTAIEQAGKEVGTGPGEIRLVGLGASRAGIEGLRSEDWFGTVLSLPADEGRIAAETVIKAIGGDEEPVELSAAEQSGIPPELSRENLPEDFQAQWEG